MNVDPVLSKTLSFLNASITLADIRKVCQEAGRAIMSVYQSDDFDVQLKSDGSPVTKADIAAHQVISSSLQKLTPAWPVLSEEDANIKFSERSLWKTYWLVDPLDGTRSFIQKSDEFTVNIALIHNNEPCLGMVYLPLQEVLYFGSKAVVGAWRQVKNDAPVIINTNECNQERLLTVAVSHYMTEKKMPEVFEHIQQYFPGVRIVEWAGAIKGCLIADGSVDLYPRPGATCEWDTAALQALIEAAGGALLDGQQWRPIRYNEKESLINPSFYAVGDPLLPWNTILPPIT